MPICEGGRCEVLVAEPRNRMLAPHRPIGKQRAVDLFHYTCVGSQQWFIARCYRFLSYWL